MEESIRAEQAAVSKAVITNAKLGGAMKEFLDVVEHGVDCNDPTVFEDMSVSQMENVQVIESLCMRCYEQGTTKLLLTRIPHFRDVVLCAFECPHCFYKTADVQSAKEIQVRGCKIVLHVTEKMLLNRQVIKENTATLILPDLEFEIPPADVRGAEINTIEGFIASAADNLESLQPQRFEQIPEVAEKIAVVIAKLRNFAAGEGKFDFIIDDPSGNSFLQNPFAPAKDPYSSIEYYERSSEQDNKLGLTVDKDEVKNNTLETIAEETEPEVAADEVKTAQEVNKMFQHNKGIALSKDMERQIMRTYFDVSSKAVTFASFCHACLLESETRMCIFDIPFFKEIVMMVSDCSHCGFKDSEVKPGGRMSEKGRKVTLQVNKASDLKRDLLKSDTAAVEIPELELELWPGTLGGKYTTVEGLLQNIRDKLMETLSFNFGDSATEEDAQKFKDFHTKLQSCINVEMPFTLILDDPLGNAFIHNENYPAPDPQLTVVEYERTQEQNDELGISDMKVEDY